MDERSDMSQLSTKLAMARLRHEVGELESQVAQDRKLIPPSRKVFHCVVDDTALTSAIAEFKGWIQEGAVVVTVPLCTLDGLDQCKKGTDIININSREAIRYFDRIQNGSLSVRGLSFQNPTEKFDTWKQVVEEYMIPGAIPPGRQQKSPTIRPTTPVSPTAPISSPGLSPQPRSPAVARQNGNSNGNTHSNGYGGVKSVNGSKGRSNSFPLQQNGRRNTNGTSEASATAPVEPSRRIQQLLNCVLYRKHKVGKRDAPPPGHQQLAKRPEIHLITNSPEITAWARVFDISVLSSNVLEDMIEREDFIYAEKVKDYQEGQLQVESNRSGGGRGGRGGGGAGRGGNRSGGNVGAGGRNNHGHGHGHPTNGGSGGGRGHRSGGSGEPDFVFVREAPRGVARGKGKLWEP